METNISSDWIDQSKKGLDDCYVLKKPLTLYHIIPTFNNPEKEAF